jgi:hypothetical protein
MIRRVYGSCSTEVSASDFRIIKHPVTGRLIEGYFVMENGTIYGYIGLTTKEEAEKRAESVAKIRTAVYVTNGETT